MLYSIYRQRRLIALVAALPGLSALLAFSPSAAIGVGLTVALVAAAILAIWPASHIDVLGLSIATTLILPLIAFATHLAEYAVDGRGDAAAAWLYLILSCAWFFLWLGGTRAICTLDTIPAGELHRSGNCFIELSPENAADALLIKADKKMAMRECGPASEDGYFEVSFEVDGVNQTDFESATIRHSYLGRVMAYDVEDDGAIRSVQQTTFRECDPPRSSVIEQRFAPENGGTRYSFSEVHDLFSVLSRMLFWLQDAGADALEADINGYLGRPVQSCMYGSQVSLLSVIARWFVANGYAPKNDPDA